ECVSAGGCEVLNARSLLSLIAAGGEATEGKKEDTMSFGRVAASAVICTFLSAVCASAKPITITADTNLRKSPGTDSQVLTLIPKGTTVEVGKCTKGWCQTSLNGQDGYA